MPGGETLEAKMHSLFAFHLVGVVDVVVDDVGEVDDRVHGVGA